MPASRAWRIAIAVAASVPALLAYAGTAPFSWDRPAYDAIVARAAAPADPRVVVVDVDDASLDKLRERWPVSRKTWAALLNRLGELEVGSIALDAFFPEPSARVAVDLAIDTAQALRDPPRPELLPLAEALEARAVALDEDRALLEALSSAGNVILGVADTDAHGGLEAGSAFDAWPEVPGARAGPRRHAIAAPQHSLDTLAAAAATQSALTVLADPDTIVRRYSYIWSIIDRPISSLALGALQVTAPKDAAALATAAEGLDRGSPLLRPLVPGSLKRVSLDDVLSTRMEDATAFKGATVLVGVSAEGAADFRNLVDGRRQPGILIHATAASNLLRGDWIRSEGTPAIVGLVLALAAVLLLSWLSWSSAPGRIVAGASVGLVIVVAIATRAGLASGLWIPITPTMFAITLLGAADALARGISAEQGRRRIRAAFQHYLSPHVIEELVSDPTKLRLGGEKRQITAFFSDIKGFSTFAERMEPAELIELLNESLGAMTSVLLAEGATIDKYIGDAIVAMFGAPLDQPDHAERAIRAALKCQQKLAELAPGWAARGWPEVYVRIGLNSGDVLVGNLGSAERFDYTMIGDAVNLASRLEGANSNWGTRIMVGEACAALCGDRVLMREIDSVRVKGRREGVRVYEPLALPGQETAELRTLKDRYESALEAFRSSRFDEATTAFRALAHANDAPSKLLLERSLEAGTQALPEHWDGVFEMKTK